MTAKKESNGNRRKMQRQHSINGKMLLLGENVLCCLSVIIFTFGTWEGVHSFIYLFICEWHIFNWISNKSCLLTSTTKDITIVTLLVWCQDSSASLYHLYPSINPFHLLSLKNFPVRFPKFDNGETKKKICLYKGFDFWFFFFFDTSEADWIPR